MKVDFLAGPERPATPRGSQSAKEAASGAKAGACNTVSVPGEALAQPRLQVCWGVCVRGILFSMPHQRFSVPAAHEICGMGLKC